jgi:hypothetical protein
VVGVLKASAERFIDAPPADVYGYLTDFRVHHPRILPPAFSDFHVEQGGVGAGTVHSFRLKVGGRSRRYLMVVAEPDPGRVFTESDTMSSAVTTFVVAAERKGSRVLIETRWQGAGGLAGYFERRFGPRMLRRLYRDELERLDRYAAPPAARRRPGSP